MGPIEILDNCESIEKLLNEAEHLYFKYVQLNETSIVHNILDQLNKRLSSEDLNNFKIFKPWPDHFVLKKSGDSALHICARCGFLDLMRCLVEKEGANIEQINKEGKTALHDAAQFSQLDILIYLIARGGNVNMIKKADWTPLMLACTKENEDIVYALLNSNAELHYVNKDGWNCFHLAARVGNVKIFEILMNRMKLKNLNYLIQVQSKNGRRPLHTSVLHGHLEVSKVIVTNSTAEEINCVDECGTTPLMDACRSGHLHLVEYLVNDPYIKGDIYRPNKNGLNCLHIAAESGQNSIVEVLINSFSIDINIQSENRGMTALHFAAKEGKIETLKKLVELGASKDVKDSHSRTAKDIAVCFYQTDSAQFLGSL